MELPIFQARDTFAEAALRLGTLHKVSGPDELEQIAALWQIAYELDRIAAVMEESHK